MLEAVVTTNDAAISPVPGDDETGAGSVVRRAPFSDNPTVGARGQRTQQRILDAALRVFGEDGYHQCSIDRITKRAGCSRVSFYQYFSGKEDVFRQLTGQVARQLRASTEALDPLTPDATGWASLHGWITRYGDIYERYEPVFNAWQTAAESDEAVAGGGARVAARYIAGIRSRVSGTTLAPRHLDPLIELLVECLTRTCYYGQILRTAAPGAYPRPRVDTAVTDVVHRTLFGIVSSVNVHDPARRRPRVIPFDGALLRLIEHATSAPTASNDGETMAALLAAGRTVFVQRGFHATRVDDIVAAAGFSHGAFYRYFDNKAELAQTLAVRAMVRLSSTLAELPALDGDGTSTKGALRRWLRRYNEAQSEEAAMLRVWVDAATQGQHSGIESAAVVDWGRRRLARFLETRGYGDVDTEAVVMVALIDSFGARPRARPSIEAAAHVVERGLLGH